MEWRLIDPTSVIHLDNDLLDVDTVANFVSTIEFVPMPGRDAIQQGEDQDSLDISAMVRQNCMKWTGACKRVRVNGNRMINCVSLAYILFMGQQPPPVGKQLGADCHKLHKVSRKRFYCINPWHSRYCRSRGEDPRPEPHIYRDKIASEANLEEGEERKDSYDSDSEQTNCSSIDYTLIGSPDIGLDFEYHQATAEDVLQKTQVCRDQEDDTDRGFSTVRNRKRGIHLLDQRVSQPEKDCTVRQGLYPVLLRTQDVCIDSDQHHVGRVSEGKDPIVLWSESGDRRRKIGGAQQTDGSTVR